MTSYHHRRQNHIRLSAQFRRNFMRKKHEIKKKIVQKSGSHNKRHLKSKIILQLFCCISRKPIKSYLWICALCLMDVNLAKESERPVNDDITKEFQMSSGHHVRTAPTFISRRRIKHKLCMIFHFSLSFCTPFCIYEFQPADFMPGRVNWSVDVSLQSFFIWQWRLENP